jgi:hypothetical protein
VVVIDDLWVEQRRPTDGNRGGAWWDAVREKVPGKGFGQEEGRRRDNETAEVVIIDDHSVEQRLPTDGHPGGARW